MSDAHASFGALFKTGDGGGPEVFTALAECKTINGIEISSNTEEVTHHTSTRRFKETVKTTNEMGNITLGCNWLPNDATQDATTGLVSLIEELGVTNFQVITASTPSVTWTIPGRVVGVSTDQEFDGASEVEFEIEPSGAPTLA